MERYQQEYSTKRQNRYTEEFKRHVCEEFMGGAGNLKQVECKYELSNSTLANWLKQLGYPYKKQVSLPLVVMSKPSKSQQDTDALVNKLKRELEDAKFQAEMYRMIIERAEQELKIKIRKNINTK